MQHNTEENQPLNVTLWSLDRSHPYLKSRGIAPETAEVFGVGFFSGQGPLVGRVVIPIHNAVGQLVGYAGRAVGSLTDPKYITVPSDFRPDRELFNLHRTTAAAKKSRSGVVVVVEGFFDCMRVHQAGFHG